MLIQIISMVLALPSPPTGRVDWSSLRLPEAVKLVAIGYNNGIRDEPFDKIIAEIGPDWVRSEQHLWQGSFGYRMYDFTYDTMQDSLIFNFDSNRGRRWDSFRRTGISRVERLVTPIGFVRVGRRVERRGGAIARTTEVDCDVYGFEAPESGLPKVQIVVDHASREIREVRLPTKVNPATIRYDEWKELADGTRHPTRIHSTVEDKGKLIIDREEQVESMDVLDPHAGPSAYVLPAQAEIVDEGKGIVIDGHGQTIGRLPAASAAAAPPTRGRGINWSLISIVAGTSLILLAGLALLRRVARGQSEPHDTSYS